MNLKEASFGSITVAKRAGISLRQLYHWVDTLQVVKPEVRQYGVRKFRRFTLLDIEILRQVRLLLESGYTLQAAIRKIREGKF